MAWTAPSDPSMLDGGGTSDELLGAGGLSFGYDREPVVEGVDLSVRAR